MKGLSDQDRALSPSKTSIPPWWSREAANWSRNCGTGVVKDATQAAAQRFQRHLEENLPATVDNDEAVPFLNMPHDAGKAVERWQHVMFVRVAGSSNIEFQFIVGQGHGGHLLVDRRIFQARVSGEKGNPLRG